MMLLNDLLKTNIPQKNIDIQGLAFDSRAVKPGFLFVCLHSAEKGGKDYIQKALEQGTSAVMAEESLINSFQNTKIPFIKSENPRSDLALLASRFYPSSFENIAAVTGTNGKTSTAWFAQQLWAALGLKAMSLGTLGIITGEEKIAFKQPLTTPDPLQLHETLHLATQKRITHLVLEASSHGLHQHRLDGLPIKRAAFTNLTQDHLDYHPTMEDYFHAKAKLFEELLDPQGTAILNADSENTFNRLENIAHARGIKTLSYGYKGKHLKIKNLTPTSEGVKIDLKAFDKDYMFTVPLIGLFQVYNVLAALGLVYEENLPFETLIHFSENLKSVPGRMEKIGNAPVFVDYAHTPDALEKVLKAARLHTKGKLKVVFGCGGNRDALKRPLMGAMAQKYADILYVTDDNPRFEDPGVIRKSILEACPQAYEIPDRAQAILKALASLEKEDILIVAGKGHETGQIIGHETIPFSDQDIILKALSL
jgi:UDP-N-acetylmuramoyl-L-alanyl-D-glutamate--2,6-diaminopimelate ligase